MIKIVLSGGLGNQMFQYAAARAISLKLDTPLLLDTSFYSFQSKRKLEIFHFNICGIETRYPIFNLLINKYYQHIKSPHIYVEKELNYGLEYEYIEKHTILKGYFQSVKYFIRYQKEIRSDFELTTKLDNVNIRIAKLLEESESVAVHIRRGDYVGLGYSLPKGYYEKSICLIKSLIKNPSFFIFSDDIKWCKNILGIEGTYISWNNGEDSWKDMILMSKCKHNIIANSSFSRRGARLNKNDKKIVVAPKFKNNGSEPLKERLLV